RPLSFVPLVQLTGLLLRQALRPRFTQQQVAQGLSWAARICSHSDQEIEMDDDWRLQIDLDEANRSQALTDRLDAHQPHHDLSGAFHDRFIVTRDGDRVFLYAGTREQAEKGRAVVEAEAQQKGWMVDIDLRRWHPIAEEWEDHNKALPVGDAARHSERE